MKITKMKMPQGKYSIKQPYTMKKVEGIVVHNTFNTASAKNEAKYMQTNTMEVSFHAVVDENEVIECAEFNRNCWHCGNRKGNLTTLGIEIARSKSDLNTFKKAEANAAKYIASLLKKYNLPINKMKRHYDWADNKKKCPHRTMELGWDRFIKMVEKELKALNKTTTKKTTTTKTATTVLKEVKTSTTKITKEYTVIVNSPDGVLTIREKPDASSKKKGQLKNGKTKYTIVEEKGSWGRLKSGVGWINLKYTKKG